MLSYLSVFVGLGWRRLGCWCAGGGDLDEVDRSVKQFWTI